jgi:hypothetical protein
MSVSASKVGLWTPNSTIPGATIKGLVLICAQCQKEFPVEGIRDGLCLRCLCTRKCKPLRDELVRLYRKRQRYAKTTARLEQMDEQAQRVRERIIKVVKGLTVNEQAIHEIVNEQGSLAREEAIAHSRIRLPAFGRR